MSLGVVLDVAIGLALTYMLLGLIASALQETVAVVLKWRGRQLRDGIASLLAGVGPSSNALFEAVFGHSLVKGLSRKGLPSYVPARNFSAALFDALANGSKAPVFSQLEASVAQLPECPAKESLRTLLIRAGGDLDKVRASVEAWYDDAMDRLSGDYKRFTHWFALGFGLVVAVLFNVDSVNVAKTLWADPGKRAAIVAIATQYAATAGSQSGDIAQRAQAELDKLPIPIGWPVPDRTTLGWVWAVLGWLATALAVSLGAPFWFDMLQKVINLRGAGPKPARSDEPAASG